MKFDSDMNLFEFAARNHIRFSHKGEDNTSAEDLCYLSLESLDSIYKGLKAKERLSSEDSLLSDKSAESKLVKFQIELVTYVVDMKKEEASKKVALRETIAKRQKLLGIKAEAEDVALRSKSPEELQKMIDDLDSKIESR